MSNNDTKFNDEFELDVKDDSESKDPLSFIQKNIKTGIKNVVYNKSKKDKRAIIDLSNYKGFSFNDEK